MKSPGIILKVYLKGNRSPRKVFRVDVNSVAFSEKKMTALSSSIALRISLISLRAKLENALWACQLASSR